MNIFINLLDLLFPRHCTCCHRQAGWLCVYCRSAASPTIILRSDIKILIAQEPAIDSTVTALYNLKYNALKHVADCLASIMTSALCQTLGNSQNIVIVPVPTDSKRVRKRGFDQASLLADLISASLNIPVLNLLKRVKLTKQQVGLSRKDRIQNLKDAFQTILIPPRAQIILIDDVCTTGATMRSAIDALEGADVYGIMPFTLFGKIDHLQKTHS